MNEMDDVNEVDLSRDFIRVDRTETATLIFAGVVDWPDSHTPTLDWQLAATLPPDNSDPIVQQQIVAVLADTTFFAVCPECGERKPLGWMIDWAGDKPICQQCAEQNHHVAW